METHDLNRLRTSGRKLAEIIGALGDAANNLPESGQREVLIARLHEQQDAVETAIARTNEAVADYLMRTTPELNYLIPERQN